MSEEQFQPMTREEWIERIKKEGREEVIKKEMIRLGFWKEEPVDPATAEQIAKEQEERKQLVEELNQLKKESEKLPNIKEKLKEAREKRIEESKRKRAERKAEREKERQEAKKRWEEYKATHVIHVGDSFSAGLQNFDHDEEKLIRLGLPLIRSAMEMAEVMHLPLSRLKWLTYHRNTATLCHYARFTIPKKNGGVREISAPKKELRQAQAWVKERILDRIPVHQAAYGFVPGRSTVDHAKQHLKQAAVIKMDLKDFFPTINFWRVKGVFRSFGYSEAISTLFALLCTEPPRTEVEFDGKYYYIAMGERQLPQGACTSPALTNIICRRLDHRLSRLAETLGFTYTRYADDLAFSCDESALCRIGALMTKARDIIDSEGFMVNEEKTRVLRSSQRQKVTGIVVNEKPNISRKELKKFRALLHNVERNGLEKENRQNHPRFWEYIQGYVSYIRMVRPDLGEKFSEQLVRIARKYQLRLSAPVSK
ncbi:reverse transcriptase family protein [Thermoflavimicrobium dichotomicum]|uniref:RNA-directed DNA polymerase n=1 Tax=Thermoflavimicrobium dichotomicum TaxID=46223 RepID=A0A1I3TRI8_9BACL|nr:reverse transcriptase family protein [Thermoflavimicrobium dichotomicum]SFJ73878.1 Reverse transcriptase (RNA-dependent DNA polymerase) [Thermoflavimicrobium dichotomicum]